VLCGHSPTQLTQQARSTAEGALLVRASPRGGRNARVGWPQVLAALGREAALRVRPVEGAADKLAEVSRAPGCLPAAGRAVPVPSEGRQRPPPRRTKWTRRVPPPVLIGHAASLNPYPQDIKRQNRALFRSGGRLARWRTRVHRGMTSRQKKRGKSGASPGPEPMYGLQRGASGADLNCRATVLRNALPRGRLLAGIVVLLEFRAELCSILQAKLLCADTWGSQTM